MASKAQHTAVHFMATLICRMRGYLGTAIWAIGAAIFPVSMALANCVVSSPNERLQVIAFYREAMMCRSHWAMGKLWTIA